MPDVSKRLACCSTRYCQVVKGTLVGVSQFGDALAEVPTDL